jgi:hypothetical protein
MSVLYAASDKNEAQDSQKKIKYLIASNDGLAAFFDDLTVAGCPRCDYIDKNIEALYEIKPHSVYSEFETYLLIDGKNKEPLYDESGKINEDFAIINYKAIRTPRKAPLN